MPAEQKARRAAEGDYSRTITGIRGTSVVVDDLPGADIYDCRVKAVAADNDNFSDSPWSTVYLMDHGVASAIDSVGMDVEGDQTWFTLQGIRLEGAPSAPGIYIMKSGSETRRVMVK